MYKEHVKLPVEVIDCTKINHVTTMYRAVEGIAHFEGLVVYTYTLWLNRVSVQKCMNCVYIDDLVDLNLVDYLHVVSLGKI